MKKLALAAVIVWALYSNWGALRARFAPAVASDTVVVLYATEWCGYCRIARRFLRENGIPYVEHDIERSTEARARYRVLGGEGVPLLEVNGRVIRGYDPDAILAALR